MIENIASDLLSDDPRVRNRAVVIAGSLKKFDTHLINSVNNLLNDNNWMVRGNASKTLAKLQPSNINIFYSIFQLLEDGEEVVRIEALESLIYMAKTRLTLDDVAIKFLAEKFVSNNDTVKSYITEILQHFSKYNPLVANIVLSALESRSAEVVLNALRIVSTDIELTQTSLAKVASILGANFDEDIKEYCLFIIRGLGFKASELVPVVENILSARDSHLQIQAAFTLHKISINYNSDTYRQVLHSSLTSKNSDEVLLATTLLNIIQQRDN